MKEKDKIDLILEKYQQDQLEFEQHWLWKQLGTTPKEFFELVQKSVKRSGLSEQEWQARLAEAKQVIETRMKESKSQYHKVNFQTFRGLRA